MNLEKLVTKVEQWSKDRGLDQADSAKQFLKVAEEVGEVAADRDMVDIKFIGG